jgi:dihydrodipicolinate synthase/N-acetylneuraminate lyase
MYLQASKRTCSVDGGITYSAFDESLNLAGLAADKGAEGVVLAPPFYFAPG